MAEPRYIVTFDVTATQRVSVEIGANDSAMSDETRRRVEEMALQQNAWEDVYILHFVDIKPAP
jgi:hypothetical protein